MCVDVCVFVSGTSRSQKPVSDSLEQLVVSLHVGPLEEHPVFLSGKRVPSSPRVDLFKELVY